MNFLEIFRYRTGADLKFVSVDRFMLYDLKLKRVVKDISVPQDRLVIGYHFRTKEDFPFPRGKPYSVDSVVFKGVPSGQTVRQIPVGPLRDVWSSEDNDYIIVVQEQQVRVWRIRNLADLLR
jgi:hypothetical protein